MSHGEPRAATADDAVAIVRLVNRAFLVEQFFVDGDRTTVEEILEMQRRGRFLVVEDAHALVACVYIEIQESRGYFGLLSVDPDCQGQGLGRLLVERAEEYCRIAGCHVMDIRVVDVRRELPPFYQNLGYREIRREPFSQPARARIACEFIVMSKELV